MDVKDSADTLESSSGSELRCSESGHGNLTPQKESCPSVSLSDEWIIVCGDYSSESSCGESEHSYINLTPYEESSPCASLSDEQINSYGDYSSESSCGESEHSNINLTPYEESSPCASLSDEQINSYGDYSSESSCGESEHSNTNLSSYEESSPCVSLSDEQINYCGDYSCQSSCRESEHSNTNSTPYEESSPRRMRFNIGLENSKSHVTAFTQYPEFDVSNHRTAVNSTCRRSTIERATCCRPTSRGSRRRAASAVQHYTTAEPLTSHHRAASVPHYLAASVPHYRAAYDQCSRSSARACCRSHSRPSCRSSLELCVQSCSRPCRRSYSEPCCRSCSEPCCLSLLVQYFVAEAISATLSYHRTALPNYRTTFVSSYPDSAIRRPRRMSARQLACARPKSKINPRRGVIAFTRHKRGPNPFHTRYGVTKRDRIAILSRNQLQQKNSQDINEESDIRPQLSRTIRNINSNSSKNSPARNKSVDLSKTSDFKESMNNDHSD